MQIEASENRTIAEHCECPLNGDDCCGCGKFECEEPSETATRHADENAAQRA